MRHQGVMIASIRTYLGILDGYDTWEFFRYVVGIQREKGKLVDYQTGEEYDVITRDENDNLTISRREITIGKIYAVETLKDKFDKNTFYSDREIKRFIREETIFTDEYKNITRVKGKVMVKK